MIAKGGWIYVGNHRHNVLRSDRIRLTNSQSVRYIGNDVVTAYFKTVGACTRLFNCCCYALD